ncbi:hypothetical protein LTR17_011399 [Elasticomyces elasticus]|nr:hypothetical protein LTR17_011399 [Elasticomyces elasticus]
MAPSKRLIGSYLLDWIIILAFAAAGGGLNYVRPKHRPFSLLDPSLSFPMIPESVTTTTLALVALLSPAVVIILVALVFVPGFNTARTLKRKQVLLRKSWEAEQGLAGLALALALAFFVTQGLKNMFGKPRPHMLALCIPNVLNVTASVVGGYGQDISPRWTLVDSSICQQMDSSVLDDAFRSFPSGHASFSWSGLLYLALFLCTKLAISIPRIPDVLLSRAPASLQLPPDTELLPLHRRSHDTSSARTKTQTAPGIQTDETQILPLYNQAAAPPNYGIIIVLVPLSAAAYITSTRYAEFWHFGFDVLSGALIGSLSAWFSFRWYHLPFQRGQGWAWGPRSRERAFGIGVGTQGYVGKEGWESTKEHEAQSRA